MSSSSTAHITLYTFHQMKGSLWSLTTVITQVERSLRAQQNDDSNKIILLSINFWTAGCSIKTQVRSNEMWGVHRTHSFQRCTPVHSGYNRACGGRKTKHQDHNRPTSPDLDTAHAVSLGLARLLLYCTSDNLGTADIHPATPGREALFRCL